MRGVRMSDALRPIEAFEFLFECELKTRSLSNMKHEPLRSCPE